jgi:hypothetical protein
MEPESGPIPLTISNVFCVFFISLGIMALYKRYKDKEIRSGPIWYS